MITQPLTRRTFLQSILLATTGVLLVRPQAWALTSAEPLSSPKRLVVMFLRGAVDGLSVVIPYGDPHYYAARPTIAIPRTGEASVRPLDEYFGIPPALVPVLPLWQEGTLAFVHTCGSPDPSRSHFDAQAYMESGMPGQRRTPDGWMNRLLRILSEPAGSCTAVNIGPTVAPILSGPAPVTNLALGRAVGHGLPLDRPRVAAAFERLYQGGDPMSRAFRDGQTGRQRLAAELDAEQQRADGGAPLPVGFAQDATQLAHLMRRDPSIRLVFLALGGWDTHVNQGASAGQLAKHLGALAEGIATLRTELGPVYAETVILVLSEFGRTVHENGNGGTDHGHGNVLWVVGGKIRGRKVYGQWPGLTDTALYEDRDLAVTTDFRTVISTVLHDHFGLAGEQVARVLPEASSVSPSVSSLVRG